MESTGTGDMDAGNEEMIAAKSFFKYMGEYLLRKSRTNPEHDGGQMVAEAKPINLSA